MKNEQSNLYSQLNSNPETMLLTEKTHSNLIANRENYTSVSEKEIMVALGFIISLLLLSGWQLYRSFNISPAKASTSQIEVEFNSGEALVEKLAKQERNEQIIKFQSIQNAISHGKF